MPIISKAKARNFIPLPLEPVFLHPVMLMASPALYGAIYAIVGHWWLAKCPPYKNFIREDMKRLSRLNSCQWERFRDDVDRALSDMLPELQEVWDITQKKLIPKRIQARKASYARKCFQKVTNLVDDKTYGGPFEPSKMERKNHHKQHPNQPKKRLSAGTMLTEKRSNFIAQLPDVDSLGESDDKSQ